MVPNKVKSRDPGAIRAWHSTVILIFGQCFFLRIVLRSYHRNLTRIAVFLAKKLVCAKPLRYHASLCSIESIDLYDYLHG